MKISIIGSRTFNDYDFLKKSVLESIDINDVDEIVSGGARGADKLGELFAGEFNKSTNIFLPDWDKYGKRAGFIRNADIIKNSDFVFAFWDGESKGTLDSINTAKKLKKKIIIFNTSTKEVINESPVQVEEW